MLFERSINPNAKILIVGESPVRTDFLAGRPYIGMEGKELDRMLHEAKLLRTDCHITYVCQQVIDGKDFKKYFKKHTAKEQIAIDPVYVGIENLKSIINETQPELIIALGELALWALTGEVSITKWRGSILATSPEFMGVKVIPTYTPDAVLRKWDWRFIAVQDLRRAEKESHSPDVKFPEYNFIIRPDFSTVMRVLNDLGNRANIKPNETSGDLGRLNKNVHANPSKIIGRENGSTAVQPPGKIIDTLGLQEHLDEQGNPRINNGRTQSDIHVLQESEKGYAGDTGSQVRSTGVGDNTNRGTSTVGRESDEADEFAGQATPSLILSGDIETRRGHIACFGIGWSKTDAICIPFICVENHTGYWTEAEEIAIVLKLKELFEHPNIGWIFQNGIYDFQYFATRWGFIPHIYMDTMLAQHTCFSGLPKGLDFQSSLYCMYHRYWKDEGKEFHESIKSMDDENSYWVYNCKDCVSTYEISKVHEANIRKMGLEAPYNFQMEQFMPVLRMMLRGVNVDKKRKDAFALELFDAIAFRDKWLEDVVGRVLNPKSPKQMQEFFYKELALPLQKNRKTGKPTTDDDALQTLARKEPLVAPVVQCISELRSLGVFLSTFVKAPLGEDGRLRSSYNIAGAETFRWSSSKDAFGTGLNLQNIPKGNE